MMAQRGLEPDPEKIPVGYEDLSFDNQLIMVIYGRLGNRVYPDIGFTGKDYTNLPILIKFHNISNTDLLLMLLNIVDEHNMIESQKLIKAEYDKTKK